MCHSLGELGVTYTVHLWLIGKRVVNFLLALIELFFANSYGWGAIWVEIALLERGWVTLSANFRRKRVSSTNEFWRQKTKVPWAITWCCLRDPTFSRFDTILACDTHTHTQTHADRQTDRHAIMAITRAELAISARVKMWVSGFSNSGNMIGAHQNLNRSRELTTPLSGSIWYPWASTCYD